MSGRRLFSAGSVLILSSRAVDEGFCDGKRKKKTTWRGGGFVKHSVLSSGRGVLQARLFCFLYE